MHTTGTMTREAIKEHSHHTGNTMNQIHRENGKYSLFPSHENISHKKGGVLTLTCRIHEFLQYSFHRTGGVYL